MDRENEIVAEPNVTSEVGQKEENQVNASGEEELAATSNVEMAVTPQDNSQFEQKEQQNHSKITTEQVANVSKEQFNKSKIMFLEFIKKPVTMMTGLKESEDIVTPMLFGLLQVILVLIFASIKLSSFKTGLYVSFAVIAANAIVAGCVFALGKSKDKSINFLKILALCCIATIPGTVLLIVAFLLSFIWASGSGTLVVIGVLSWVILGYHAANEYVPMDKDLVFWVFNIILLIVLTVCFFFVKEAAGIFIQEKMSALFSYDLFS